MYDEDTTPTPIKQDPCQWCGVTRTRISDDFPAPATMTDAKREWKDCVITQSGRWAWCPRTDHGWVRISMERRALR